VRCASSAAISNPMHDRSLGDAKVETTTLPQSLILSGTSFPFGGASLEARALTLRFKQLEVHLLRGLLVRLLSGLADD
jgi:hypothetical protein